MTSVFSAFIIFVECFTDAFDSRSHDKRSFVGQSIDDVPEAVDGQRLVFFGEVYLELLKQDFAFFEEINLIKQNQIHILIADFSTPGQ